MGNKIKVLVYPCGSENAIEIHSSLKDNVNIKLYGASGKEDHGKFVFTNYFGDFPYITDKSFIYNLNSVIRENNIDLIVPTHDDISLFFAQNSKWINAKIAVPGLNQAIICRSKKLTYELFKGDSFCPKVFDIVSAIDQFPVFVKPDKGQGGKGVFLAERKDLIDVSNSFYAEYVITEYLPGDEITVDCFTDRGGKLRFIGPRRRNRIFCGISANSNTVTLSKEINYIAAKISEKIKMRGLWFFQIKKDNKGKNKLLEISVRTAGTMSLYRGLGINFPLLTVYDLMNYDVKILKNDYDLEVDRALLNRYKSDLEYDTIYIDFDDTITKGTKVNPSLMFFLYHMKNRNINLKLITKHEFDLYETFKKLSIASTLFDEIIILKPNEKKYKMITKTNNVIFIDNSYNERADVKKFLNIPVFDVDAITTLIDWRE